LLVAETLARRRIRKFTDDPEVAERGKIFRTIHSRGIAHQIRYRSMTNQAGRIKITPVLYANKVGGLWWKEDARSSAMNDTARDGFQGVKQLPGAQALELLRWVGVQPRDGEHAPIVRNSVLQRGGLRNGRGQLLSQIRGIESAYRGIPLGPYNQPAITENPCMARTAVRISDFDLALSNNDIACRRITAIGCQMNT